MYCCRGSMFTRPAYLFLLLASAALVGCDDDGSSSLPLDAGDENASGDDDPNEAEDDEDDNPRGDDGPEPEPEGQANPLPPPVPEELPVMTQCGALSCRDVLVGDIIVPPCCAGEGDAVCGLDLEPVTNFMPLQSGCVALDQPGNADANCPDLFFNDPTELRDLPGCCTPEGKCGVVANLSLLADFGCVDPRTLLLGAPEGEPQSCTPIIPEPDPEPEPEPETLGDGGTTRPDAGDSTTADPGIASSDASAVPEGATDGGEGSDPSGPTDGGQ
jgi:hypothetical protein